MTTESERLERLAAMGEMAATLAHEMRNPLGSMELFCTLLLKDLKDQPQAYDLAEQIHKGITALNGIIIRCLQFSRDIAPQPQEVSSVSAFLQEVVDGFRPQAEQAGIQMVEDYTATAAAEFDKALIEQVLLNLLVNGKDALSAVAEPVMTISNRQEGERLLITLSDNGCGMSEEVRAKIFEPFFTTKRTGTGLGLPIVYAMVKAHRGTVTVESRPGFGTTIRIDMPLRQSVKDTQDVRRDEDAGAHSYS